MEPLIQVTRFGFVEAITDSWKFNQHRVSRDQGETNLIHITDGPALSNCKVNRQVSTLEVAPRPGSVCKCPFVVAVCVQGAMIAVPAIVTSDQALSSLRPVTAEVVQVEWQQSVGLVCQS